MNCWRYDEASSHNYIHLANSSSSADLLCAVLTSWFPAPAAGLDGLVCWNMSLVGITLELLHTPALLLGNLLTVEFVSEGTLLLRYFHTLLHISTMFHRVLSTLRLGCSITWCSICRLKIKLGFLFISFFIPIFLPLASGISSGKWSYTVFHIHICSCKLFDTS